MCSCATQCSCPISIEDRKQKKSDHSLNLKLWFGDLMGMKGYLIEPMKPHCEPSTTTHLLISFSIQRHPIVHCCHPVPIFWAAILNDRQRQLAHWQLVHNVHHLNHLKPNFKFQRHMYLISFAFWCSAVTWRLACKFFWFCHQMSFPLCGNCCAMLWKVFP